MIFARRANTDQLQEPGEDGHKYRAHTAVFVNPAGQRDNIGDSVLRRAYLNALRANGKLHVLVGRDHDFGSGLGLQPNDVIYISRLAWLLSIFVYAIRFRIIFAVNSGEFVGHPADKRRSTWQVCVAALVNILGGSVILAGVSIRPGTEVGNTYLRQLVKRSSLVVWRDFATAEAVGSGSVQPDWAFHLGENRQEGKRTFLAVAVRGDRPIPADGWVTSLIDFARQQNCVIRIVVQVRRDADAAVALGDRLGAEVLSWPAARSHAEHELVLREFYQTCKIIASDRIHALIIAATEGAIPIGVVTEDPAKLLRTFEHVTPLGLVDATGGEIDSESWQKALGVASEMDDHLKLARSTLDEVSLRLAKC